MTNTPGGDNPFAAPDPDRASDPIPPVPPAPPAWGGVPSAPGYPQAGQSGEGAGPTPPAYGAASAYGSASDGPPSYGAGATTPPAYGAGATTPPADGAPPAYGTPASGSEQYGQPPYGQAPYGQTAYGQAPYSQAPYAQQPSGQPSYGQTPYGQAPYGQTPYGQAPYGQTPYGQAPYGQTPYGQAPYGQTPYGQASGWAQTPKTDGMAVAALATSIGALLVTAGLLGIVGLILGLVALSRIKKSGASGRGLAIGGIVVGAFGMLVSAAWIGFWIWVATSSDDWDTDSWSDTSSESGPADPGANSDGDDTLPAFTLPQGLTSGTCLDVYPESYDLSDVAPVDCSTPHGAEIYDVFAMDAPVSMDLDGDDPAWSQADDHCYEVALGLDAGLDSGDGWTDVWYPHPDQWAAGEKDAYCVYSLYSSDPTLVGSFTDGSLQGTAS